MSLGFGDPDINEPEPISCYCSKWNYHKQGMQLNQTQTGRGARSMFHTSTAQDITEEERGGAKTR